MNGIKKSPLPQSGKGQKPYIEYKPEETTSQSLDDALIAVSDEIVIIRNAFGSLVDRLGQANARRLTNVVLTMYENERYGSTEGSHE